MKNMAVVYFAHDGFTSLYTGVGTIARDFLLSFPETANGVQRDHDNVNLSLYVATMRYKPTAFGYSEDVQATTRHHTDTFDNINLVELNNGSAGQENYGKIHNWDCASISAATFLYTLRNQYDKILAICVDTPFTQVAARFTDTYNDPKFHFIWLPQSTVRIHGYGMSSMADQQGQTYVDQRYDYERSAVDLAKTNDHVRIGCIGDYMRQHLIKEYGAAPETLVTLTNSLYLPRLEANKKSQAEIAEILQNLGVPTDRKLLFSFGRAEPYKGLDLVLKNCGDLIEKHGFFILIFASPYAMDDPYVEVLRKLAAAYPEDVKVVFGLDFITPHYIMQWQHTEILALLSRAEPFGIIPIEARYYHNPNLTVVVSDQDGLAPQIDNGKDGFITGITDEAIRGTLEQIATLTTEQKHAIADRGYDKIVREYNQIPVNITLLESYVRS